MDCELGSEPGLRSSATRMSRCFSGVWRLNSSIWSSMPPSSCCFVRSFTKFLTSADSFFILWRLGTMRSSASSPPKLMMSPPRPSSYSSSDSSSSSSSSESSSSSSSDSDSGSTFFLRGRKPRFLTGSSSSSSDSDSTTFLYFFFGDSGFGDAGFGDASFCIRWRAFMAARRAERRISWRCSGVSLLASLVSSSDSQLSSEESPSYAIRPRMLPWLSTLSSSSSWPPPRRLCIGFLRSGAFFSASPESFFAFFFAGILL